MPLRRPPAPGCQVYVKASAFFRVSAQPYPWHDAGAAVRLLIDTFGVERVLFGTDWPWVAEHCSYVQAWGLLDAWEAGVGGRLRFSPEERTWLQGGALLRLLGQRLPAAS